ncbi:MAG: tripartite tricarboxylate transporter substrate binding protein [Betaproteobacteria bacterium]|nr:tripartite tricarboxylate transporter substrate binding protein [Betaproteobacteria bacterium]
MTRSRIRRNAILVAALALTGGAALDALAQTYPSRPIRFIVPYGAGGGPDVTSRVIGRKLGEILGQPIVIDNKPGGAGIIATEMAARAPADGYTVLVGDTGPLAINPALYPKLPYDPLKDFAPVTLAMASPLFLVSNPKSPFQSITELIAYARANPGVTFGSTGNASVHHLGMELFQLLAGVKMTHIPYKGVAFSVPAVMAGDIAVVFAGLPSVKPHLGSGKLRILGVADAKRTPITPDVPAISEGLPGYEIKVEVGFLVPAGTPREVIARLNREIRAILAMPDIAQHLVTLGINPIGTTPEQYTEQIKADMIKFAKLVKDSGAKVE